MPDKRIKKPLRGKPTKHWRDNLDWEDTEAQSTVEKRFAREYVKNGNRGAQAVRTVWGEDQFKGGAVGESKKAARMLAKPRVQALVKAYENQVMEELGPSVQKIAELRDSSEDERVQLNAAKAILEAHEGIERRHERLVDSQSSTNILVLNMDENQLLDRIKNLTGEVYGDKDRVATDVSPVGEGEVQEGPPVSDGELSELPESERGTQ